ncbi:MAG: GNAT family N-acetyltransferase [Thermoplasmata archaeon]|nr:GNAT family N-acetyltransferase [Thermoplasmata archaeon]
MTDAELRDARSAREDELLELVHGLQKDLAARGERLPTGWTEEAIADLRSGQLTGWFRPPSDAGGELGFYSRRPARGFGHVHVLPGLGAVGRTLAMMDRIASDPPARSAPLNLGVTGLTPEDEAQLVERWPLGTGRSVTIREGLERALDRPDLLPEEPTPTGLTPVPITAITTESIADLDRRAFEGSVDADLFAGDPAENQRMIARILEGSLGRLLEEASVGLVTRDGRLVGAVLSVELSPHIGLVADLLVDPGRRRQGLGRHLLRWTLRALRALGHGTARLWVTEGNRGARALYDQLGFSVYARAVIYRQVGASGEVVPQPHSVR